MPNPPNSFVWYELMTTDMDAAEAFYRAVVGWEARDSGQQAMRYTLFSAGDTPVAGLMTLPPNAAAAGARPGWAGYIGVEDVSGRLADRRGRRPHPSGAGRYPGRRPLRGGRRPAGRGVHALPARRPDAGECRARRARPCRFA